MSIITIEFTEQAAHRLLWLVQRWVLITQNKEWLALANQIHQNIEADTGKIIYAPTKELCHETVQGTC